MSPLLARMQRLGLLGHGWLASPPDGQYCGVLGLDHHVTCPPLILGWGLAGGWQRAALLVVQEVKGPGKPQGLQPALSP